MVLVAPLILPHGLRLRPWSGRRARGNSKPLPRPARRGGWPSWRRAACAGGARPGESGVVYEAHGDAPSVKLEYYAR